MEPKLKRDTILYTRIQKKNFIWIESQMKKLGYISHRGKSEFLDALLSKMRKKSRHVVK